MHFVSFSFALDNFLANYTTNLQIKIKKIHKKEREQPKLLSFFTTKKSYLTPMIFTSPKSPAGTKGEFAR